MDMGLFDNMRQATAERQAAKERQAQAAALAACQERGQQLQQALELALADGPGSCLPRSTPTRRRQSHAPSRTPAVTATPAGSHPDPSGHHQPCYWNGRKWTEHVADKRCLFDRSGVIRGLT
jgi:hypothetical protein